MCHGQMLGDALRTARRQSKVKCWFCEGPIHPGQEYREWTAKHEAEIVRSKAHLRCSAMYHVAVDGDSDACSYDPRGDAAETLRALGWREFRVEVRTMVGRIRSALTQRSRT